MDQMNPTKGVSAVIQEKAHSFEEEQKAKIISVCSSKMKYADVLNFIENEIEQSKRMSTFRYRLRCWRSDGAYQLNRAITEVFGVAKAKQDSQPSGGESPIETLDIVLADGSRTKVPYGTIDMSDLGEGSSISISYDGDRHQLEVKGKCQYRFQSLMDDIITRTKELLATDSIYKNQILEITDINEPKIMKLDGIEKQLMVLSQKTEFELQPLRSRIFYPEKCIQKGIPLKYGCLLEGKYGTGKTLYAFKLAKDAVAHNWAFIYLKNPEILAEVLRMCQVIDRSGYGVVVFVEDIDQVTRGSRDAKLQDILNTLDGGDTKDLNVITLFTTNHIELIEPTFLRGKRIGSVITMDCLDAETAEKFIKASFTKEEGYVLDGDFTEVYKYIESAGIAPAFMAEIVESTKSKLIFIDDNKVTPFHIKTSVESYQRQVALAQKKDVTETPPERLVKALRETLSAPQLNEKVEAVLSMIEEQWDLERENYKHE
ncbi:MAG: AAA family ATPase [Clostridiales bacterium]|nr:AAA family ATPase [Clostridiales bacterium]